MIPSCVYLQSRVGENLRVPGTCCDVLRQVSMFPLTFRENVMKHCSAILILAAFFLYSSNSTKAAVFTQNTGAWPKNWPAELEPFRAKATTLGVGTGIQENIYTIPMETRADFEKIWPLLLKQTTPGSRVRLLVKGQPQHPSWGDLLKNDKPAVRIYAPLEGWALNPQLGLATEELEQRHQELVKSGQLIQATAPWPKYVFREDGSLPEYVVSYLDEKDGRMKWKPGTPGENGVGFYNRARVDLELVVDAKLIDLNRIRFPKHVVIVDERP